jgi:hypothetical protein
MRTTDDNKGKKGSAYIHRKCVDLNDLLTRESTHKSSFIIEKTIILDDGEWDDFISDFSAYLDFITANKELMFEDTNGVWHCIYVTKENINCGVLIESEGYSYGKYMAYIQETSQ